jgi:8-oxo-dGTP pyrophosphatase MutT (NUDIX family)
LEDQKVVDTLRRIRHDFGNHLQVISGHLELGNHDKVKDYIKEIIKEMAREREIFEELPAEAALYFYEQVLLARDLGVILVYEDFDLQSPELLLVNQEPYHTLAELTSNINKDCDTVIFLSVYEDDKGMELFFTNDYFKENPVRLRLNRE